MCSDNKDCPGGQVCRDNHCQTECVVDDHCVGVNQICVNKKCVARDKDGGKNRELSWRSPGSVVRGGDSSYEGRGFESQHPILDGHFHIYLLQKL